MIEIAILAKALDDLDRLEVVVEDDHTTCDPHDVPGTFAFTCVFEEPDADILLVRICGDQGG